MGSSEISPTATAGNAAYEAPEDYGFFGPDSVTWRVWSYPTSLTIGFQRAVVVEELDPFLIAPVYLSQKIVNRARVRYDNTLRYFAIVAFGDSRSVVKAADALVRIHARAVGVEPVTGLHFDANNPDSQLWIHLTAWHSILYAYEVYGPGKLSEADENRYWEECAVAAQFQTCDPAKVPRTREGVRQYFARMRPRLAASEAAQQIMDHLLNAEVMFPPVPALLRPGAWLVNKALRAMTLATMPEWQRGLAGLRQGRLTVWLARRLGRIMFRSFAVLTPRRLQLELLGFISPATRPVVRHVLLGEPARTAEVLTPEQAFARYRTPAPVEQYGKLRMSPEKAAQVVYAPSSPLPV
ncbi:MAG: oxygenase MpaB family protein [Pseudomonadota bacterium]